MAHTIELPDGYNGSTVTCDSNPIAIDGNLAKLAVMQSDGLRYNGMIRWITMNDLETAIRQQAPFYGILA